MKIAERVRHKGTNLHREGIFPRVFEPGVALFHWLTRAGGLVKSKVGPKPYLNGADTISDTEALV